METYTIIDNPTINWKIIGPTNKVSRQAIDEKKNESTTNVVYVIKIANSKK